MQDDYLTSLQNLLLSRRQIDPNTDCWNWTGDHKSVDPARAYGRGMFNGHRHMVHRLSALVYFGFDLTSSLYILHRCDNPSCFNPEHLFIGDAADNARDRAAKGRGGQHLRSGELGGRAKLTSVQVREIRRRRRLGESPGKLAREYGVSGTTITSIYKRKIWKSVH